MVDTYYAVLVFALSMVKHKNVLDANFSKDVQWLAETLFLEKKMQFFESCNQPSIQNAKATMLELKVFKKQSVYVQLHPDYAKTEGEKRLRAMIAYCGTFRSKPTERGDLENATEDGDLRRVLSQEFPFMSKL